jgi:hypothetical protein
MSIKILMKTGCIAAFICAAFSFSVSAKTGAMGFLKVCTHIHTENSYDVPQQDTAYGVHHMQPDSVVMHYQNKGYDAMIITDHHTITLDPKYTTATFIQMAGEELYSGPGAPNDMCTASGNTFNTECLGTTRHISCYYSKNGLADSILTQGGIPQTTQRGTDWPYNSYGSLTGIHLAEVFGGEAANNPKFQKCGQGYYDSILSTGTLVYMSAGDDAHTSDQMFHQWSNVLCNSFHRDSILKAMNNGMMYVSNGNGFWTMQQVGGKWMWRYVGPSASDNGVILDSIYITLFPTMLHIVSQNGDSVYFFGKNGAKLQGTAGKSATYMPTGSETYVRGEVRHHTGGKQLDPIYAWTEPLIWNNQPVAGWVIGNIPTKVKKTGMMNSAIDIVVENNRLQKGVSLINYSIKAPGMITLTITSAAGRLITQSSFELNRPGHFQAALPSYSGIGFLTLTEQTIDGTIAVSKKALF